MTKDICNSVNYAAQIAVITAGFDVAFTVLNGGSFPLTKMFVGVGVQAVSTVVYTIIDMAGPVKGSAILGATALYTTEHCGVTHLQDDLQQSFQSYFFNPQETEVTGQSSSYEI